MTKRTLCLFFLVIIIWGCKRENREEGKEKLHNEVQTYLDKYSQKFQGLYYTSAKAEWKANTHIVPGDTATANRVQRANEALAAFTGSDENIEKASEYLEKRDRLTDLQIKQLNAI